MNGNLWIILGIICGAISLFAIPYGFHLNAKPEPNKYKKTDEINIFNGDYVAGNKITNEDSVIRSLELKIHLDYVPLDGVEGKVKNNDTSFGLANVLALFSKEKVRYRFITDYKYSESTLESGKNRISFHYKPEDSDQILGKPIKFLKDMQVLGLNYSEFIKEAQLKIDKSKPIVLQWNVYLNSVKVFTVSSEVIADTICNGQAQMGIGSYFRDIDNVYQKAVR
ncbi:MAG: hypothetical protein C4541_06895 [Candidatus Auribacter fodinae]|uniref:Uncharacterized protein n=1 Tax=Candidatus Auribacter fodinae TaxID=2093366 RepID=A0A3A4R262_9BACT|nr:MAG: hypothetical protein C4541_06895 [Candidatus Auribacter fodinae]